jgi:hypothetical protein
MYFILDEELNKSVTYTLIRCFLPWTELLNSAIILMEPNVCKRVTAFRV